MIIAIDASTITPNKAGIGYYTYSLLLELSKQSRYKIFAYVNDIKNIPETLRRSENVEFIEIYSERPNLKWIKSVSKEFKRLNNGIFISPSNFSFGILIKNSINVVHDLAPVKYKKFFSKKGVLFYNLQLWLLKKLKREIVVPSNSIKQDLMEYGFRDSKVKVILEGVHEWVHFKSTEEYKNEIKLRYKLPEKYFVSVSTLEPRKNHVNLIKGFYKFNMENPEYHLVLVGKKGWFYDEIFHEVKNLQLENKVIFVGYAPEEDLAGLLDLSDVVVNISFYEGFALNLIEAGIRGKRLVASEIEVFKEIVKDNALYTDPNDVDCIAKILKQSLDSNTKTETSFFDQYSWQKCAMEFLEYAKMLSEYRN